MNVEINDWINMTKIMYYLVSGYHDEDDDDGFVENNLTGEEMLDEVIELIVVQEI
jgi:hypothetical protein